MWRYSSCGLEILKILKITQHRFLGNAISIFDTKATVKKNSIIKFS